MKKIDSQILFYCAVFSAAAISTGCSPISAVGARPNNPYSNSSSLSGSSNSPTSLTTRDIGNFVCPAEDVENVTPYTAQGLNVDANYQVCTNPSSESQVMVFGNAGTRDQICVFPVESQDTGGYDQNLLWQQNPADTVNTPWFTCAEPSANGAVFNFQGLDVWNGAYIVDAAYAVQMQDCLIAQNVADCPDFSYGTFRN